MDKNAAMAAFVVRNPSEIDCPAPEGVLRWIHVAAHQVVPGSLGVLVGGSVFLAAYALLRGIDVLILMGVVVVMTAFGTWSLTLTWLGTAPIDLRRGILNLPSRVRRRDGTRTTQLDLADLERAENGSQMYSVPNPNVPITRVALGISLTFRDGTGLFLTQRRFGTRGLEVLEKIARLHGFSYIEWMKSAMMGAAYPHFRLWNVHGFKDEVIILSQPMPTFQSGRTRRLRPEDVWMIEPLETGYAGKGYLFTRNDGIMVLLPAEPLERWGVFSDPRWADKVAA